MTRLVSYDRVFRPVVLLRVDRQDASDVVGKMSKAQIVRSSRKAMTATFDLHETAPGGTNFIDSLVSDPRLQAGALWEIRYGYFDDMSPPRGLIVTHYSPKFESSAVVGIQVHLTSQGARLSGGTRPQTWPTGPSSDVARAIAARHGLESDITDSDDARTGRGWTQRANQSDFAFLSTLADRIRFVCYVDGNTLVYRPARFDEAPRLELVYFHNDPASILKSFTPEVKRIPRRSTRTAGASDNSARETSDDEADTDEQNSLGTNVVFDAATRSWFRAAVEPTADTDARTRQRRARADQRGVLERANKGRVVAIGTPRLDQDINVQLIGVGADLSGVWHVETATHTIDGTTYTTECDVKRGATNTNPRNSESRNTRGNNADAQDETGSANGDIVVDAATRSVFRRQPAPELDEVTE